MTQKNIPAVSIVIPMYNTEKFIAECLDSILAQSFTDFEVIVVDNCSTDNSAAIVEGYATKFENKNIDFQLIRREVGSVGGGIPRNLGVKCARGEYIMFIDSDDAITNTALEELFPVAKDFNADVVACEKFFISQMNGSIKPENVAMNCYIPENLRVNQPTLISNDILERVNKFYQSQIMHTVWSKLIRRNFLIENNIQMIDAVGQDVVFSCCLVCSAEKYVIVPNAIYFYRQHENSTYNSNMSNAEEIVKKWLRSLMLGFNYLDEFLSSRKTFQENPEAKHIALGRIVNEFSTYFLSLYMQIPTFQFDRLLREEFSKLEDKTALLAYLFGGMNISSVNFLRQQNTLIQQESQIQQLQAQLQQSAEFLKKQQKIIQQLESALQQK